MTKASNIGNCRPSIRSLMPAAPSMRQTGTLSASRASHDCRNAVGNRLYGKSGNEVPLTGVCMPRFETDQQALHGHDNGCMRARFPNHRFSTDTGRKGRKAQTAAVPIEACSHRGNWCNTRNAGIGQRAGAEPMAGIDAFVWIEQAGASGGTRDKNRSMADAEGKPFEPTCGAEPVVREKGRVVATGAMSGAPAAGKWFDAQLFMLVRDATPAPLGRTRGGLGLVLLSARAVARRLATARRDERSSCLSLAMTSAGSARRFAAN